MERVPQVNKRGSRSAEKPQTYIIVSNSSVVIIITAIIFAMAINMKAFAAIIMEMTLAPSKPESLSLGVVNAACGSMLGFRL